MNLDRLRNLEVFCPRFKFVRQPIGRAYGEKGLRKVREAGEMPAALTAAKHIG